MISASASPSETAPSQRFGAQQAGRGRQAQQRQQAVAGAGRGREEDDGERGMHGSARQQPVDPAEEAVSRDRLQRRRLALASSGRAAAGICWSGR